jgi:uncharacterized MnhB-related membrane protein
MTTTSAYNYVNWSNMNSFTNFITNANNSGGGFLFTAINFLVFIVLFITLTAQFGWQSAILSSAFIGMILSLLFVYMGVMNIWIAGAYVGIIVVMFLYLAWKNNG